MAQAVSTGFVKYNGPRQLRDDEKLQDLNHWRDLFISYYKRDKASAYFLKPGVTYQDIEGRNNDDKNKIKLIADWSRQTPGLNVIGGTQLRPARQDSSEAILRVDQNTFSKHDRRDNANSDSNLNDVPTYI